MESIKECMESDTKQKYFLEVTLTNKEVLRVDWFDNRYQYFENLDSAVELAAQISKKGFNWKNETFYPAHSVFKIDIKLI